MAIFDSLTDKLAEWGVINAEGKELSKWFDEKSKQATEGVEIVPPWFYAGKAENFPSEWHGKDHSRVYADNIWPKYWSTLKTDEQRDYMEKYPPPDNYIAPPWASGSDTDWVTVRYDPQVYVQRAYFGTLTDPERIAYFEKWPPTTDDWFDIWTTMWDMRNRNDQNYFERSKSFSKTQSEKLETGEVEPPWVTFPVSFTDYGWEYGEREHWKLNVWLPFWRELSREQQQSYLEEWPPPSDQWRKLITEDWAGKLRHTERWHEEQQRLFEKRELLRLPWEHFTNRPGVYEWDEKDLDRWLREIWIPYWNEKEPEGKKEYLESLTSVEAPNEKWLMLLESRGAQDTILLRDISSSQKAD